MKSSNNGGNKEVVLGPIHNHSRLAQMLHLMYEIIVTVNDTPFMVGLYLPYHLEIILLGHVFSTKFLSGIMLNTSVFYFSNRSSEMF